MEDSAAAIKCTEPKDLQKICRLFPEMTGLIIKYAELRMVPLSLRPLLTCFHLDYLRIEHQRQYESWGGGLDLSLLPNFLRTLDLVDAVVNPSTLDQLSLPPLTKLSLSTVSLSLANIKHLLQCLPALQEMEVKDQRELKLWRRLSDKVGKMWGSSQQLTRLKLDVRGIGENDPQDLTAPSLTSLHLCGELLEADWLNDLFRSLPWLDSLTLSDCQITDEQEITPGLRHILVRD